MLIGGTVSGAGQAPLDAAERHLRDRTLVPPRLALTDAERRLLPSVLPETR